MKRLLFLTALVLVYNLYAQEEAYARKNYLGKICRHVYKESKKEHMNKELFRKYARHFSKFDTRPLNCPELFIKTSKKNVSVLPNFIWVAAPKSYRSHSDVVKAWDEVEGFTCEAASQMKKHESYLSSNIASFNKLLMLVVNSRRKIFLNQGSLNRVDSLFRDRANYWKYKLPQDTPFPISDEVVSVNNSEYSQNEEEILKLIKENRLYAVFKDRNVVYFLIDSFMNRSYGYIYNNQPELRPHHLFRIKLNKRIKTSYSYFIAH